MPSAESCHASVRGPINWPFTATAWANRPAASACSKAKNPGERAGSRRAGACSRLSNRAASRPGTTSYPEPVRHGPHEICEGAERLFNAACVRRALGQFRPEGEVGTGLRNTLDGRVRVMQWQTANPPLRFFPHREDRRALPHETGSSTQKKTPTSPGWGRHRHATAPFPRKDVSAPCRAGLLARGMSLLSAPSQGQAPQWSLQISFRSQLRGSDGFAPSSLITV